MKKTLLALSFLASSVVSAFELKTESEKIGYGIGLEIGSSIRDMTQRSDVSYDALIVGLRDAYEGKEPLMKPEEIQKVMESFADKQIKAFEAEMEKQKAEMEEKGKIAAEEGKKFLEENKTKEGVNTTVSGLQYKVITEGKGAKPKETDTVLVHYEGKTLDGKVFDSSYVRKDPIEFQLNLVIPGWVEGLQLMSVGSKYEFFIPAELAYGKDGAGNDIPPNSTLIFTIELIDIKADKKTD